MTRFFQIMPPDEVHQGLIKTSLMDVTEIESYGTLFNDLEQFEMEQTGKSNIRSILPEMISAEYVNDPTSERAFYLLLKDLSPEFQMRDFNQGLSLEEVCCSLRALAQYHATAFAFGKVKGFQFGEKYSFLSDFFNNFLTDPGLQDFMASNMDLVQRDLSNSPDHKHLLPHVKNIVSNVGHRFVAKLKSDNWTDFLMHGDIWANNMLFKDKSDCRIVDWQFTANGSVFLDFGTLAFISMSPKQTEISLDQLTSAYFDKFEQVVEELGAKSPWTKDDFAKVAQDHGLFLCFLWCSTSYELVEKYPKLKERVFWVLERSIQRTPEFYA